MLNNSNPYIIPKSYHTASKIAQSAYDKKEKGIVLREQCRKFKNALQPALVTEALNFVLQKALPDSVSESDRIYGKKLCENFVAENDSTMLLKKFKCKTVFLAEMALAIESACTKIESSINPADQLTLEDAANKTKEKIDAINTDNEETAEAIKKECTNMYKSQVEHITSSRKRNIYEQMVNQVTSSIVKTESIRESFIVEGKLDMPKIISKVNVMYTFLEMVNTTKMCKVDERYISEVLKSIK